MDWCEVWCEIGRTAGDRGCVNVMNVDVDIVDDGCNGEMISDSHRGRGSQRGGR